MTWNLNALDSCFSLPDKGAVFSKGEMVGAREGETEGENGGVVRCLGLYKLSV